VSRTLVICKPDAVERGLSGEIIRRLEQKGLRLLACELRTIDRETAAVHYEEHRGKAFFDDLVEFIGRSPAMVMVIEGPPDTWRMVRSMMGPTDPAAAAPGTIRGDLGTVLAENLIHGSDGPDSAEREIALFFPSLAGDVRRPISPLEGKDR